MKKIILLCFFNFFTYSLYAQGHIISSQTKDTALNSKIALWMQNNKGLKFVENKGQMTDMQGKTDSSLLFKASSAGVDMYVTTSGISYVFIQLEKHKKAGQLGGKFGTHTLADESITGKYCRADMNLLGANIKKENIEREYESIDRTDYYLGGICPDGILNVHNYQQITVKDIYPGIDWVIYTASAAKTQGKMGRLQYDFIVYVV